MSLKEKERCCVDGCRYEPSGACTRCYQVVCIMHVTPLRGAGGKNEGFLCPDCWRKEESKVQAELAKGWS